MTANQIHEICVRHGVTEWEAEFRRLFLDYVVTNRAFGRLTRKPAGRVRAAFEGIMDAIEPEPDWFFAV